jgi:carboxyl-terminal processing protease
MAMRIRRIILQTTLLVIALVVAFVGGFSYQDLSFGGKQPLSLFAIMTLLPQHVKWGLRSVAFGDQEIDASPLDIYADTLAAIQSDFYGTAGSTRDLTYSGIRGMMASLGDRYTRFLDPKDYSRMQEDNQGEFPGIGAQLDTNPKGQVYIVKPLPDSPALHAHVQSGDIVIKVNNKPVIGLDITRVVEMIRGAPHTPVTLTLLRKGASKPMNITIIRNFVHQEMVVWRMIDPEHKIGYIELAQFNEESDPQMNKALSALQAQGMRGLIFDLRGNPGGLLNAAQDVASRFVASGPIVWVKERGGSLQSLNVERKQHNHPQYPLVVLVNEGSASASEITSGAIKDTHSGSLIGERTYGKGLVQTIIPLPDKSAVAITTAHYFTPAMHDINHKGIQPDIPVILTDTDQKKMATYLDNHPEDPLDVKDDRQLQKALSTMVERVEAGSRPHAWQ